MAVIRQLKNWFTGQAIHPVTRTKAVYDDNNVRLDQIIAEMRGDCNIGNLVEDIGTSFTEYIAKLAQSGAPRGVFVMDTDYTKISGLPTDLDARAGIITCSYIHCFVTYLGSNPIRIFDITLTCQNGKIYRGLCINEKGSSFRMVYWKLLSTTDVEIRA